MATIKSWPQWLTFFNIPDRELLPCKFELGVENFSFLTLFDFYRELLWISFHIEISLWSVSVLFSICWYFNSLKEFKCFLLHFYFQLKFEIQNPKKRKVSQHSCQNKKKQKTPWPRPATMIMHCVLKHPECFF